MDANEMRNEFNLLKESGRLANRTFNDREIEQFMNKAQKEFVKKRFAPWKNRPQIGFGQHPIRNTELAGVLTATQSIPRENYIKGTENNGALRGPDLDQATQDDDKFGVFIGIPNEALYIIGETCKTEKDNIVKENTPIKEVNYQGYIDGIYDKFARPYDNLTWAMDWGSFTTAVPNASGAFDDSVKQYSSEGVGFNMQGENYLGATIEINTNRSRYLIPGKGWKVTGYVVHYIKLPRDIRIDVQTPSLQVNCELPSAFHDEIVSIAVEIASATTIPDPNQYQVNKVESKEDE